jgi:hypothetical protein
MPGTGMSGNDGGNVITGTGRWCARSATRAPTVRTGRGRCRWSRGQLMICAARQHHVTVYLSCHYSAPGDYLHVMSCAYAVAEGG